jgi:hypothetical protein
MKPRDPPGGSEAPGNGLRQSRSRTWHGIDQELAQLAQVQTRALRRLVAAQANVADYFVRYELACRHTAQIGQQRKLELAALPFSGRLALLSGASLYCGSAKCAAGGPVVVGDGRAPRPAMSG